MLTRLAALLALAQTSVSSTLAPGIDSGFVFSGGKIVEVHQPDLEPACSKVVLSALRGVVRWLIDRGDARATELVENDCIRLTPETIPAVVQALREWRQESGLQPPAALVSACARFDPVPG